MNQYTVYITPDAREEIKRLPGNVRQRVKQLIHDLANGPIPPKSRLLDFDNPQRQLFRIRIENWRIIYMFTEAEKTIDVLAIRRRPPYDYGDLNKLLESVE